MNAATRGVILAVVAVVLGVLILGQGFSDEGPTLQAAPATPEPAGDDGGGDDGSAPADDGTSSGDDTSAGDDGGDDAAATDDGSTDAAAGDDGTAAGDGTATTDDGTSETPDILHPPAEVRVLVANGTNVAGAAGRASDQLVSDRGYGGLTPTNADAVDETAIYYVAGYELDARQIAEILNASPTAVAPMPATPPVEDLQEAHVLVVLGPDLVSS